MFELLFSLLILVYNPETGDLQAYRQQNLTSEQCFIYKESLDELSKDDDNVLNYCLPQPKEKSYKI